MKISLIVLELFRCDFIGYKNKIYKRAEGRMSRRKSLEINDMYFFGIQGSARAFSRLQALVN